MTFLSIPALQPHSVDIRFRFVSKYGEDNAGPLPIFRRCNGGAGIELSVHDPELRHGHKAAIVVDTDSQLITAVDVLPGNAPDNLGALELVEQSEASTGSVVEEAMGDAAYGDGGTRQTFADAGRRLVAKVPGRPDRKHFPKMTFTLTWPRAVAPVRRGRLPAPSCRRESGWIAPVVSIDCRLSSSTGRYVGYVRCAPSASRPKAGRVDGC